MWMAKEGYVPRSTKTSAIKTPESEKITINVGFVDLGRIDLLVREGFYSSRSDFIRTSIRNQNERHADTVRQVVVSKSVHLGVRHITKDELVEAQAAGQTLDIRVLGLAIVAPEISADLARSTISTLSVLGALHATDAVKAALADRLT
jgi:Arc/MetJ-type ribon-helix-helix transcriptional regulator